MQVLQIYIGRTNELCISYAYPRLTSELLPVNPLGIYLSSAVYLKKFVPEYSLALVWTGCSPNLGGLPSYTMGRKATIDIVPGLAI